MKWSSDHLLTWGYMTVDIDGLNAWFRCWYEDRCKSMFSKRAIWQQYLKSDPEEMISKRIQSIGEVLTS
jgi:hypothetical protein